MWEDKDGPKFDHIADKAFRQFKSNEFLENETSFKFDGYNILIVNNDIINNKLYKDILNKQNTIQQYNLYICFENHKYCFIYEYIGDKWFREIQ